VQTPSSPASSSTGQALPGCVFFCVSNRRHFPGAVALFNSLRLAGHDEPVVLVDAGLTADQRRRLAEHLTVLDPDSDLPPVYLAPAGPARHPAGVAVVLDADIIVVRSLAPMIELARTGRVVGFVNDPPNDTRFFPEWSPALGLGPLRRRPYLNAGQFFIPHVLAQRLLPAWEEGQRRIEQRQTRYGGARMTAPFYFADQDVVNAVLAALLTDDEVACMEHELAPHTPLRGIRVVDRERVVCEDAEGRQPFLLHHTLAKPWLQATATNAYTRLLPRLLLAPDVPLRLRPEELPLRLREGRLAGLELARADMQARAVAAGRRQLGRFGIRTRLSALASKGDR